MLHLDDPTPGHAVWVTKAFPLEFFRSVEQVERSRDVTSASSELWLIMKWIVEVGWEEKALIMSELSL